MSESLVFQVTRMLAQESYHYCADCQSHCRQTILVVEALKESLRERSAGEARIKQLEAVAQSAMEWFAGFPHKGEASGFDIATAAEVYNRLDSVLAKPDAALSAETQEVGIVGTQI